MKIPDIKLGNYLHNGQSSIKKNYPTRFFTYSFIAFMREELIV